MLHASTAYPSQWVFQSITFSDVQALQDQTNFSYRISELVTNDMAHKASNYGSSKVQGASITTRQSNLWANRPHRKRSVSTHSTLSLTKHQRTLWSKNTLQTSPWLLSGRTVFIKPQAGKLTQIEKVLQICSVMEWFDKTWQRPKKGPIFWAFRQIYEQCSCSANAVLREGKEA